MRTVAAILLGIWLIAGTAQYEPAPAEFTTVREVKIAAPNQQNYFVVDKQIWRHARADLADVRLYNGQRLVPYVLREQRGGDSSEEPAAKILNLGTVAGHTEFDIDMGALPQYNRVRLQLDARNFVATAQIAGRNDLSESPVTQLGQTTLYDFSRENLGTNFFIQLPALSFRYLHVRLRGDLHPEQVKGAIAYNTGENKPAWTPVGWCPGPASEGRQTVEHWQFAGHVPVDRIHFSVPADEGNFRRHVTITDVDGVTVTQDEISRLTMMHEEEAFTVEHLDVDLLGVHSRVLTVTIENGNESPLHGLKIQPLSIERRIYFDPEGIKALQLYYGNDKLSAPVYDYAKSFRESTSAVRATISPEQPNVAYAGDVDSRPWPEKHKRLLWGAMIFGIIVIGGSALRGMGAAAKY